MSDNLDPEQICRDEACRIVGVHRKHLVAKHAPPKPHHRPTKKPAWEQHDPKALRGAVARATSKAEPKRFAEIARDVRDDYGNCTDRSIYRHLRRLVERGHIRKFDVDLDCAFYVRPGSRLMTNPEAVREYALGTREITATTKRSRAGDVEL